MGNYISNFKESIRSADIRKTRDILLDLHLESDNTKIAILNELAMVSDQDALLLLDFIIRLETQYYKSFDLDSYDRLIQLIIDRSHLNFEFALILYKTRDSKKILEASSLIKYILTRCTEREILFETINAVGNERLESLVPAIAEFVYYDDQTLKEQAITNLVKIGSQEVYKILFNASKTVKNDRNIINALESLKLTSSASQLQSSKLPLQQSDALLPLSESLKLEDLTEPQELSESKQTKIKMLGGKTIEERFEAFNYFLKLPSKDLTSSSGYLNELISNLKSDDRDLVVNSLRVISHIASEDILPDIYSFLSIKHSDPSLEYEAFEALCSFEKFSFTEIMLNSIEKPEIHLRTSAIKALDKHYNDPVYAKIKNRIETGRGHGRTLVHTIIDAHAQNLINYLLVSDAFADMASTYLIKYAAPSALNNYLKILTDRGLKGTARKIESKADMATKLENRLKAVVISSSDTVHKIYEQLLFKNGYIQIGFNSPEDAFEMISTDKPDLIVSELFAKDMTALDFARQVREFYSRKQLPFLISTSQNDFLDIDLSKQYKACDISGIFKFPEITKAISELIKK